MFFSCFFCFGENMFDFYQASNMQIQVFFVLEIVFFCNVCLFVKQDI